MCETFVELLSVRAWLYYSTEIEVLLVKGGISRQDKTRQDKMATTTDSPFEFLASNDTSNLWTIFKIEIFIAIFGFSMRNTN